MKKTRICICAGVMLLVCILTFSFLQRMTTIDSPLLYTLDWETSEIVNSDGSAVPFQYTDTTPVLPDDASFRFSLHLPALQPNAYLIFETSGAEITIALDGKEYYHSSSVIGGQDVTYEQAHLTLPPHSEEHKLEMYYIPTEKDRYFSLPVLRVSSEEKFIAFYTSNVYRSALPAGAFALAFVLVCAVFLTGVAVKSPDWSMLFLALAVAVNGILFINTNSGAYYLPHRLHLFLLGEYSYLLPLLFLAIYLFLNRQKTFFRYLVRVSFWTVLVFVILLFLSASENGTFFLSLKQMSFLETKDLFRLLLQDLNIYMTAACCAIAAYSLMITQFKVQSSAQTLAVKNQLMLDNYHTIEQSLKRTSAMRHEWKNQIAALHLLQKQGNLEKLGRALEQLDLQLNRLAPRNYCENYTINAILQNAAFRAESLGIKFHASAPLPTQMSIDEGDLCSLLLNLLDNAMEAAAKVEKGPREINCTLQIRNGYFAVKCENTYHGTLSIDENGQLQSSHSKQKGHGFGLAQMRAIAKKYGSTLDISYTDSHFIVQTALKLL